MYAKLLGNARLILYCPTSGTLYQVQYIWPKGIFTETHNCTVNRQSWKYYPVKPFCWHLILSNENMAQNGHFISCTSKVYNKAVLLAGEERSCDQTLSGQAWANSINISLQYYLHNSKGDFRNLGYILHLHENLCVWNFFMSYLSWASHNTAHNSLKIYFSFRLMKKKSITFIWKTEKRNSISYFTKLCITKLYNSISFKINRNFEFREKALKFHIVLLFSDVQFICKDYLSS